LDQGVNVVAFHLRLPFSPQGRAPRDVAGAAAKLGVPLWEEDAGRSYVTAMLSPRHGRGVALNPCLDCKVFIIKRAAARMAEANAAFIFTGDVLGQRPMSQKRPQLELIARKAGLAGKLLRPLSAQLLEPTEAEIKGWVDRSRLLALSGRGRKAQMELATAWGIDFYPSPAGGCLLTDRHYCARLSDAAAHDRDVFEELPLLAFGRHFRLPSGAKVVVGRNRDENAALQNLAGPEDVLFESAAAAGATALLRKGNADDWPLAAAFAYRFSDAWGKKDRRVRQWRPGGRSSTIEAPAAVQLPPLIIGKPRDN